MAKEETTEIEDSLEGVEELEKILGGSDEEEGSGGGVISKFRSKLKNKIVLISLIVLFIILAAGAIYWFLNKDIEVNKNIESTKESTTDPVLDDETIKKEKTKEKSVKMKKANIYQLESFFIPINLENSELGSFVSLELSFVLSNRKLNIEIDKNIGEIREQIYEILKTKKPIVYVKNRVELKKLLKKEIVSSSNKLLASGSGTISDLLFTKFIIK
tara:strand:- start:1447 stop:2094 length:648 start_codon:yes stop_codon:yes gene_type:complete